MLQYSQTQEEQVFTACPWGWSFDVPSCIGPRGPPGLEVRMEQLPHDENLLEYVKCCAPAARRKILRQPRNKPGTGPYGGTASNLHWGSVLTQSIFLLMIQWYEQTQITWHSHTGNFPSICYSVTTASMWWEGEEPWFCSLSFSCRFVLQLEWVRKKWPECHSSSILHELWQQKPMQIGVFHLAPRAHIKMKISFLGKEKENKKKTRKKNKKRLIHQIKRELKKVVKMLSSEGCRYLISGYFLLK